MKILQKMTFLIVAATGLASLPVIAADDSTFAGDLLSIQHEFDTASFSGLDKDERAAAFEALVVHAAEFSERYPARAEALAWNGIVLSSYAGEVSAFGAMKYAKAARKALHAAESIAPQVLDGGLYASLGALYSKVPGGFVGFGDDELAAEYFEKALAVDPDNIDSNFFYGEFLLDQERFENAVAVLDRALEAPEVSARPLFDAGRREAIRELLKSARDQFELTAAQ